MGVYVTEAEVRAEGVGAEHTATTINSRILKWEQIVEKLTKNIFRKVSPGELIFDGNNRDRLHFNIPLIAVSSVKVNEETTALTAEEFRAFTGISQPQDDRGNPKIELTSIRVTSLFTRGHGLFVKGLKQLITADWGHVDPDPATPGAFITPPAVKDAIIQLVIRDLRDHFSTQFSGNTGPSIAPIQRERTDGHEIEYADMVASITWAMIPNDIRDILLMFRSPLHINIPQQKRFVPFHHTFIGGI
ncbi:hypothetical protein LCGC14_0772930 [marine sediment metagenome]|uniref:Uncharacterized protein n=1 Tax=marine sediment metagenome TaxID=412755 RepID=A0A0F9QHL7_9ZZZZ